MSTNQKMPSKPTKILVLGAAYGTGNMGVDALLSGTIASAEHYQNQAEILLLDYGHVPKEFEVPSGRGKRVVRLLNLRFSWRLHLRNNGFRLLALAMVMKILPSFCQKLIGKIHPLLDEIRSADLCLALAGGDSFSDIYGMRRLLYVSLPQFLVVALGRRLVLLPQTIGPFERGSAKMIARWVMKKASQVYARDSKSLSLAEELSRGAGQAPKLSQDMAFALVPQPLEGGFPELKNRRDSSRPLVGLNVSGLLYGGGYTGQNEFGISADYHALMERVIRYFIDGENCDVLLITHVTGAEENDTDACRVLAKKMEPGLPGGSLIVASPDYDHRQIKSLIGHCEFMLGSRMHATIAALSQGVPAVGLAYSRKFIGVYETINAAALVVDLRSKPLEQVMIEIKKLYKRRAEFAEILKPEVQEAKRSAETLLEEIMSPSREDKFVGKGQLSSSQLSSMS